MFIRHLISRINQLIVLLVLLLLLCTTVLSTAQPMRCSFGTAFMPAPIQVADGWSDPVGG